jgi:hypothetical protein
MALGSSEVAVATMITRGPILTSLSSSVKPPYLRAARINLHQNISAVYVQNVPFGYISIT